MTTVFIAVEHPKSGQEWVRIFQELQPDWQVLEWTPGLAIKADIAIVWRPDAQLFVEQPQLKAVFNMGAGVDAIDFDVIPEQIPVYRVEDGGMAVQMAEYAIYGVLNATQRFAPYVELQQQNTWKVIRPVHREQWPIGVMGYGQIGQKVVQSLEVLGYPVSAWVRTARHDSNGTKLYAGEHEFDAFLAASRILVNVLPLTPETTGLLNKSNLLKLQPDSYLINMARGPHVVDQDLLEVIDSGHMSGALLDVFHQEPLPATHPFWQHPRITMTPHISGVSLRYPTARHIHEKAVAFLGGQSISGLVQRQRLY
ncbi:MAG TPA: glyoxylate/hydroxypyruvate reductase A [Paenalcaligenes hominis]|uniref:Glyoxylate/hydroxypyruvate reductase A n=1 Tax=Paenalcaligenes hominis TaxID=643674 RepID=A0A9D2VHK0_9BURK|nr:glyoxylate/hydroxypyruvate reductase A [Paenalcaligenes hominis]